MGGALGTSPDTHQILDTAIMSVDPQTQSLFDAIAAADRDRVKHLINAGVSVNSANNLGQTPLLVACHQRNLEIADLLVAAGAQMQVQAAVTPTAQIDALSVQVEAARQYKRVSALPVPNGINFGVTEDEMPESPVRDRQISYDDFIEIIHQPADNTTTEIETLMPNGKLNVLSRSMPEVSSSSRNPTTAIELSSPQSTSTATSEQNSIQVESNWQDLTDDESTYTFDLDAVFASKEPPLMSLNPDQIVKPNPAQPLAEPLCQSIDLDNTEIFVDGELTITALKRPVTEIELESSETYAFYLNRDLDLLTAGDEEPDELSMPMGEWEEGETYLIDLDTFDRLGLDAQASEPDEMINVDGLLTIDGDLFTAGEINEDGETYAIDLNDLSSLSSYDLMDRVHTAVKPEQQLLADLNPHLFTTIGGDSNDDDEPDLDPDTQTSTDILGWNKIDRDETEDETLADGENATNTSLIAAIVDGDIELVQQVIAGGVNLDRCDWQVGYSPLGVAIVGAASQNENHGRVDLVQCLLTAGANPHCGSISTTALGLAAERGATEIIQILLSQGVSVNEPVDRDNWTALLSAIKGGHKSVVELLVTAGANVNIWSRGETPILLAAKCEERDIYHYLYPLVNTSIRLCADRDGERLLRATRNRRIRAQNRPVEKLIAMAIEENVAEVNRAIEIGVEIDELGAQGHTALMAAAYYGHKSIVKILLEAGANPHLLSDDDGLGEGMTALMFAAQSFFASNRHAVFKLLLASGADVNQRGAGGKTAIFAAALAGSGYQDCVETAIAAGADLDLRDDRGHTVLALVAAAENYQILNLLIQAGASTVGLESIQLIQAASAGNLDRVQSILATQVNLDLDRGAAIGKAAAAGYTQIVKLLIQAGANVNLSDQAGFTPIASAAYSGHGEIVNLLIDAGADIQAPASGSHCYSALEYAQMGLYQFDRDNLQHAQIIRQLEQLEAL
jgi:ankyrin repeat protein